MGWNTAGLLVETVSIEVAVSALPDGPEPNGESVSGFEAFGSGLGIDYAIAQVGDWTVIADPHMSLIDGDVAAGLSRQGRCLSFLINDVSTTYGVWLWTEGAVRRSFVYAQGDLAAGQGDPLPEEAGLPSPAVEDHVMELVERLTGVRWAAMLEAGYQELVRQRGFFRR